MTEYERRLAEMIENIKAENPHLSPDEIEAAAEEEIAVEDYEVYEGSDEQAADIAREEHYLNCRAEWQRLRDKLGRDAV